MNTEAKTFCQILEENFQKSEFNIYRYLTRIPENYETAKKVGQVQVRWTV